MQTCERCGADAVDARGICQSCGWHAAEGIYAEEEDDAPSLGATRAADAAYRAEVRTPPSQAAAPRATHAPGYGAATQASSAAPQRTGSNTPVRFCGACGARVAPGEVFCGQCGTPLGTGLGAGGMNYVGPTRNMPASSAQPRYYGGTANGWLPGDGDAPTEAFVPPPATPPYQGGVPYMTPTYGVPQYGAPAPARQARTGRVVWGLLCLAGSLLSAAGAVFIALGK